MFGGGGWLVFSQPCEGEARNAIAQALDGPGGGSHAYRWSAKRRAAQ